LKFSPTKLKLLLAVSQKEYILFQQNQTLVNSKPMKSLRNGMSGITKKACKSRFAGFFTLFG